MKISRFYDEIDQPTITDIDFKNRVEKALEMIEGMSFGSILDLGCIPQITEEPKKRFDCLTVGVNLSKRVIRSRKRKDVRYNAKEISFKHKFDLVFCDKLIEHIFNIDEFIEKIKELLTDGGYLLLTTPNLASLFNRFSLLFGFQPYGLNPSRKMTFDPLIKYDYFSGHVSIFTYRAIKEFLMKDEFEILKIKGYNLGHTGENKLRACIKKAISAFPSLAEGVIVLARKKV